VRERTLYLVLSFILSQWKDFRIVVKSNAQDAELIVYCVGGYEGYSSATLQWAEEEIYEASGHC